MFRVLLRSGALSEFGVLSSDRSVLLTEMSINFAIPTGPVWNYRCQPQSHECDAEVQKRPLLPADTPTTDTSIDLCGEQLHVPVIQRELLPCD
jgi:hypothetical protein